jgi:cell division protein FtsQ
MGLFRGMRQILARTSGCSKQGGMARRRRSVQAPSEHADPASLEEPSEHCPESGSSNRLNWLSSALKLLSGLLLVLGAAGAVAYGARHFAVTADRFAVREFKAEGSNRRSSEQLAKLAGVDRGDNLFALDLEALERKLVQDPWIASAQVTRKLPDTLQFEVEEYTASALAAIDGGLYLVTRQGHPIVEASGAESLDLPVITGVEADELVADRERAIERVARGVELIRRYERLPLARHWAPQEVHMASDGSVSLTIGKTGVVLQLGQGPFVQKLLMAARIMGKVQARGEIPSIIFLDNHAHPERVVVRMR